jgi:hypothetical protein
MVVDKFEDAGEGVVEDIAGALVGVEAKADGVGDVEGLGGEPGVELADEEGFVGGLREEELDGIEMGPCHGEDPGGLGHEILREGLAAEAGEIDAETAEDFDGMGAGGLAAGGADAGADDAEVFAPVQELAEESLRHGTAADIPRANKEDGAGREVICHEEEAATCI